MFIGTHCMYILYSIAGGPLLHFFYLSLILWKHEYIIFNIFLSIIIIFVRVYFTHNNGVVEKHEILGYDVHLFLNKNAPIALKDC